MLIFWKEKLVLLAVPKTGTTAIEHELGPIADIAFRNPPRVKHINAHGIRNAYAHILLPRKPTDFELVGVMREPLAWLGSWYRYRRRDTLQNKLKSTANVSFDQFVEAYLQTDQPEFANVGSQHRFLCGAKEAPQVDRVFDYASLDKYREFLESRLKIRLSPTQQNVSPVKRLTLSGELEARLRSERKQEFELYESIRNDGVWIGTGRDASN